ncbi:MAG TPA: hypothetical protein DDW43_01565 [Nitrosomonas sp.]|nr:hypothetical protein [Nitrosomonas sp.]
MMDTLFNVTSYTSEFIDNKQATVLHDVFVNDPSIRSTGSQHWTKRTSESRPYCSNGCVLSTIK